jgi:serine/threonine protein kinase
VCTVTEGTAFGRYQLLELLGRGSMGEVYRAFDPSMNRMVALKLLPPHLAQDATFQTRFRREALAAASLTEPHVVPIHGSGEIDGRLYLDMRLIEGRELLAVIAQGPLPTERTVAVIDQIASALSAAHQIGLLHRDVKPSNIMLTAHDFAYLIDFGVARAAHDSDLTADGSAIGTFDYMAPERFDGMPATASSDLYALTCVLFQCLTGRLPFPSTSMEGLVGGHLFTPPPRPSAFGVAPAFDSVVATGMAKDPRHRFANATQFADAVRNASKSTDHRTINAEDIAATGSGASRWPPPAPAPQALSPKPPPPYVPVPTERRPRPPAPALPAPAPPTPPQPPAFPGIAVPPQRGKISALNELKWTDKRVLIPVSLIITAVLVGTAVVAATASDDDAGSAATPLISAAALDHSLLSIDQLNSTIVTTSGFTSTVDLENLQDHASITDKDACLSTTSVGEQTVYAKSGWAAARVQSAQDTDAIRIDQSAVLFDTAEQAQRFFDETRGVWTYCANTQVTITQPQGVDPALGLPGPTKWMIGPLTEETSSQITQWSTRLNDKQGRACPHAMAIDANLVLEASICRSGPADGQVERIIDAIRAKATS